MRIFQRIFIVLAVLGLTFIPLQPASAVSSDNLYLYDFANAGSSIQNQGLLYPNLAMNLLGNWSSDTDGVNFTGNTTNLQSGGNAKPASGTTLSVATNQAIGAAVIFKQATGCGVDSQNISQIGVFATGTTQVKLQLSKCASGKMYPECRIAGSLTPANTQAVRGTLQLAAGKTYKLECVKGPDAGTTAPLVMRTTDLATGQTTVNNFSIPDTGSMSSTAYLTAGNKYPLPSQTKNTDQYNGSISKLGYCRSTTLANAQTCLDADVVATAPNPGPDPEPEPTGPVDEIKYAYGSNRDEVVFSWRGNETKIYYGSDNTYGLEATATPSSITPVDIAGPFMEARLTGLDLGATYHYKIGTTGPDNTFKTAVADDGSFKAVAIGDTAPTTCRTYQQATNDLVTAQAPDFVLHHGDIAIANECGVTSVHQFYTDIEQFTRNAAFMPVWGNHEYGNPTAEAPAGTPRDSLANYKGRSAIPNPQTVPNDTATKTGHPGCGAEVGSSVNTCRGEDWGWFRSGRVLFISFPEPWPNAITDWQSKVQPLMQQAQDDPTVDFIVTYGHRPLLSSTNYTAPTGFDSVFTGLADTYGPSTSNPGGKYVLNLAGHRHNMEVFDSYHGVTHAVNGGGGQGLLNFGVIMPGSVFRMKHLGFSTLEYDANAHLLTYKVICGPSHSGESTTCAPGVVMYSQQYEHTVNPS